MAERFAPPTQRGAALLTVLLLVAVMAVISATALDRLRLATRLAGNAGAIGQARAVAAAAEAIAAVRIADLLAADPVQTVDTGWQGRPVAFPVPGGVAEARLYDAGNCFNLNSLVEQNYAGSLTPRLEGRRQFAALLALLGAGAGEAEALAAAASDWIDSDDLPLPGGAEDAAYAGEIPVRRTAGRLLADPSELKAVRGVTPALWLRIAPFLCALPEPELSPININSIGPDQAPLIAMLPTQPVAVAAVRAAIAKRPAAGYGSVVRFWNSPEFGGNAPATDAASQLALRARYFRLVSRVTVGDVVLDGTALIDAREAPARVVLRDWSGA